MRGKHLGLILAGLLASLGAARADEIILVDGGRIIGQVIEETPDAVTVKVHYGTFRLKRSRILSITKESTFKYHLRQGDYFASRGQLQVAISEYRKAHRLQPNDKVARQKYFGAVARQGRRYLALRRHADARRTFEELARLDPGSLDARAGLKLLGEQLDAVNKLVAGAEALMAAGRHGEAVTALTKAVGQAPEKRPELAAKLAAAYRGRAEEHYLEAAKLARAADEEKRKRSTRMFTAAAGLFAQALELKPDLAAEVEGRFISSVIPGVAEALKKKDYARAAERLAPLLEFAPTDPRVLYWVGTVQANRREYTAAAGSFARGLGRSWSGRASFEEVKALHGELRKALGGRATLLAKPFKERYTESAPGDWRKLEGERFTVYHHNEKLARLVLRSAEYYLDRVRANMALPASALWKGKCPIYVYRDKKAYRAASGQAEWSGGGISVKTAGGKLVSQKISTFQTAPKMLNNILPHELAHLVFMSALKYTKKCPLVIHEGVAVFNELAFRRSYYAGVLRTRLKTESTIPLKELFAMKKYPAKPDLFYAQGASIVQYLIEARGAEEFYRFGQTLGKLGLAKALKKHYGFKDLEEMERYWKSYAKGRKR